MKRLLKLVIVVTAGFAGMFQPDCTMVANNLIGKAKVFDSAKSIEKKALTVSVAITSDRLDLPAAVGFADPLDSLSLNYGYHDERTAIADPFTGKPRVHEAIDLDCEVGDIVYSVTDAKVVKLGYDDRSGHYATTAFHDKDGEVYAFFYAHLYSVEVKLGQVVEAGQPIALGGKSGRSTDAHLHLELRKLILDANGDWYTVARLNPTEYFFGEQDFCSRFGWQTVVSSN